MSLNRIAVGLSTIVLLHASPALAGQDAGDKVTLELATIKEALAQERLQVRSVVFQELVAKRVKDLPGASEKARQAYVDAVSREHEAALGALPDDGPAEDVERLGKTYERKLAKADALMATSRINRQLSIDRRRTVDFENGRGRLDDVDRRNVDALLAEEGLDDSMRGSIWRSKSMIVDAQHAVELPAIAPDLAVIMPGPRFDANGEWLSLGIVPEAVFGEGLLLDLKRVGASLELTARDAESGAILLRGELLPERSYRLASWRAFTPEGELATEMVLDDYRQVDGVWVPFARQVNRSRDGVPDYSVEKATLQEVEINPVLEDDTFAIPTGMRIQDTTAASPP